MNLIASYILPGVGRHHVLSGVDRMAPAAASLLVGLAVGIMSLVSMVRKVRRKLVTPPVVGESVITARATHQPNFGLPSLQRPLSARDQNACSAPAWGIRR